MKILTILSLIIPYFIFSQELTTSSDIDMSTMRIIHVNNNEIYRIAYRGGAYDYLKKNIDGEEVASIQLTNDDIQTRSRGVFYRDNHFYSILIKDENDKTTITLLKLDMNLNEVDKKEIYSGVMNEKNKKCMAYFDYNNNGFVLFRNFTKRKNVNIESYVYDFNTEAVTKDKVEFQSNEELAVIDFEISNNLQSVLLLDINASFGDLSKRTLKKFETHLIHLDPVNGMIAKKLTEDENYYQRSYNAVFNNNDLLLTNLKFTSPSNIFEGYEVSYYQRGESDLKCSKTDFYPFEDYTSNSEWGPLSEEVRTEYEKNKDKKNVDYRYFGALEITDCIAENEFVYIVVRNITKSNTGIDSGSSYLTYNAQLTSKKYKEFQITKLNSKTKSIDWWKLVYNAPRSNGKFFDADIDFAYGAYRKLFWNDVNSTNHFTIYYLVNKDDQIKLIYPSYSGLYEGQKLQEEFHNQKTVSKYDVVGVTNINKEDGKTESSILIEETVGEETSIMKKLISLKGIYPTRDKIIIPLETPIQRTSILHVVDK